ncbi:uncharacterized protein N7483_008427 [Penicillium malachiteum]|uniref:uncharacterized protein n=1 Tax=Penicillium malachiteum TaxID=1324776 RepID=UPI0025487855|nr:uncharacterized protein N7483_008427 [Penicillium malachiteum]KAJ5720493.1 hypothetical protein N7483_008427 [Penicillium malachiteum]
MDEIEIAVDSTFHTMEKPWGEDDWKSDTTSLASEIARGRVENGRRYQSFKSEEYWTPSDEQQFDAYETGHIVYLLMENSASNPLHLAPIGKNPKHILDVGTGKGSWAIDAADMYPNTVVRGVDLFPPPINWLPPNCQFEVDDLVREWTWSMPFDFIFLRHMLGSFDQEGWATLYKRCYENLEYGGWIEQFEFDIRVESDDNSLPEDSLLAKWGETFLGCSNRAGRSLRVQETMRDSIEKAGFIDVHEKVYKVPVGPWPRDMVLKEIGRLNHEHWSTGMEGYAMWLLTKFGAPEPWTPEEVQVYLAHVRADLKNPKIHGWEYARRVWARKPRKDEIDRQGTPITPEPWLGVLLERIGELLKWLD